MRSMLHLPCLLKASEAPGPVGICVVHIHSIPKYLASQQGFCP